MSYDDETRCHRCWLPEELHLEAARSCPYNEPGSFEPSTSASPRATYDVLEEHLVLRWDRVVFGKPAGSRKKRIDAMALVERAVAARRCLHCSKDPDDHAPEAPTGVRGCLFAPTAYTRPAVTSVQHQTLPDATTAINGADMHYFLWTLRRLVFEISGRTSWSDEGKGKKKKAKK